LLTVWPTSELARSLFTVKAGFALLMVSGPDRLPREVVRAMRPRV
jgi:hypothetical protein